MSFQNVFSFSIQLHSKKLHTRGTKKTKKKRKTQLKISQTPARHLATSDLSPGFSSAAATRSLSASCLLTSSSCECFPSAIVTSTLNLFGKACASLTRRHRPISVAIEQCETVGVKAKATAPAASSTATAASETTPSCSKVYGCSGSAMARTWSKTSRASMASREGSASGSAGAGCLGKVLRERERERRLRDRFLLLSRIDHRFGQCLLPSNVAVVPPYFSLFRPRRDGVDDGLRVVGRGRFHRDRGRERDGARRNGIRFRDCEEASRFFLFFFFSKGCFSSLFFFFFYIEALFFFLIHACCIV